MWVRFSRNFDFDVPGLNGRVTIAYKEGTTANVTRDCAAAAKAAGAAVDAKPEKTDGSARSG